MPFINTNLMKNLILSIIIIFAFNAIGFSQAKRANAAEIFHDIEKLSVLGTALYVAAHPDDENTRFISYLANEKKVRTAYISLTRGDGGQNLIGPELKELLGVIRTQELLAARRTDGGEQFFSRANDFGYSKNPEETLEKWNEGEVLSDLVWTIRNFKPDIIINRFQADKERRTHGHHTASALLSVKAFDAARQEAAFSEQLRRTETWETKRLYFNTSWWFYGSREKFKEADKSNLLSVDLGSYYPTLGLSNSEIAARSRSMHKCQGFGSALTRGSTMEYLELLKGDMPEDMSDPFEGINTTWTRVKGGGPIGEIIRSIENDFSFKNPSASVPKLIEAYQMIQEIEDLHWKKIKSAEIQAIIKNCLGLYIDAVANQDAGSPGESVPVTLELINRSDLELVLNDITMLPSFRDSTIQLELVNNKDYKIKTLVKINANEGYSAPYWLKSKGTDGMYTVKEQSLIGKPETPRPIKVNFNLSIGGQKFDFRIPVDYKYTDPAKGEIYQPFEVLPPVFTKISERVIVFTDNEPKKVQVVVRAGTDKVKGMVRLDGSNGWKSDIDNATFDLTFKGEEKVFEFDVWPPEDQSEIQIKTHAIVGGKKYDHELIEISYDHIPNQKILRKAESKFVKINLKKRGELVGYIDGAGDAIPQSLMQMGYQIKYLSDADFTEEGLADCDAIVAGIRTYNTNKRLKVHQKALMNYVNNGGTYIVQYNTNRGLAVEQIGPYELNISRDRVSVEEAEISFLQKDHPVMNSPNKISQMDFENWVQERGLYFADKWDTRYDAVLASNDPGENSRKGGLLVGKYGKGDFVYTGYSWFRQLPAGIPGAYRIFANLVSLSAKDKMIEESNIPVKKSNPKDLKEAGKSNNSSIEDASMKKRNVEESEVKTKSNTEDILKKSEEVVKEGEEMQRKIEEVLKKDKKKKKGGN